MNHKNFDLGSVLLITLVTVPLLLLGARIPVAQAVLAFPLVLVLPGYALTAATFPSRLLGVPERLVFTLGLSLAVAVVGGVGLHLTPWGLQAGSWALLLGGITVCATIAALVQRRGAQATAAGVPAGGKARTQPNRGQIVTRLVLFGLAIGVVGGTIQSAYSTASKQLNVEASQLWLLPAADSNTIRLGIGSVEAVDVDYKLLLRAQDQVLQVWPSIVLKPGERWETSIDLPAGTIDAGGLEALLYRSNAPQDIYRRVVIKPNTQ